MRTPRWIRRLIGEEAGAAAALIVGILIGVALVVFGIIKFLIPGD